MYGITRSWEILEKWQLFFMGGQSEATGVYVISPQLQLQSESGLEPMCSDTRWLLLVSCDTENSSIPPSLLPEAIWLPS